MDYPCIRIHALCEGNTKTRANNQLDCLWLQGMTISGVVDGLNGFNDFFARGEFIVIYFKIPAISYSGGELVELCNPVI